MRKGGTVYHFTQKTYFGGKGGVVTSVGAHFGGLLEETTNGILPSAWRALVKSGKKRKLAFVLHELS